MWLSQKRRKPINTIIVKKYIMKGGTMMGQDKMHLINKIFNNETIIKVYDKDEGNETVANCKTLKLKAQDGKYRLTDVVDIEGMFRVIEPILSKNA